MNVLNCAQNVKLLIVIIVFKHVKFVKKRINAKIAIKDVNNANLSKFVRYVSFNVIFVDYAYAIAVLN